MMMIIIGGGGCGGGGGGNVALTMVSIKIVVFWDVTLFV
jgi:hypothetical protein